MTFTQILALALGAILVENFVLVRFLGVEPFLGASKKMNTALGMGGAVILVLSAASAAAYLLNRYMLEPLGLEYMRTAVYLLVIAALTQLTDMLIRKAAPAARRSMGNYLPLVTANSAVLGIAVINTQSGLGLLGSVVYGVAAGFGFMLALILFASVRERLEFSDIPQSFEGFPIALVTAALLSMAFMGFQGLNVF